MPVDTTLLLSSGSWKSKVSLSATSTLWAAVIREYTTKLAALSTTLASSATSACTTQVSCSAVLSTLFTFVSVAKSIVSVDDVLLAVILAHAPAELLTSALLLLKLSTVTLVKATGKPGQLSTS